MKLKLSIILSIMLSISPTSIIADDDTFAPGLDAESNFKSEDKSIGYQDIVSILQKSQAIKMQNQTRMKAVFDNRVVPKQSSNSDELPSPTEDTSQNTPEQPETVNLTPGNYTETPGKSQGIWNGKTTEELMKETPPSGGRHSKDYSQYYGTANASDASGRIYQPYNIPYFSQGGYNEAWKGKTTLGANGNGDSLYASGCYFYMCAHIFTRLQGKLINPAEAHTVLHFYGAVTSSGDMIDSPTGLNRALDSMGYKVTFYKKNAEGIKDKVDKSLKAGIPVGIRCGKGNGGEGTGPLAPTYNHFLVIETLDDSGKYHVAQATSWKLDSGSYDWSTITQAVRTAKNAFYVFEKK